MGAGGGTAQLQRPDPAPPCNASRGSAYGLPCSAMMRAACRTDSSSCADSSGLKALSLERSSSASRWVSLRNAAGLSELKYAWPSFSAPQAARGNAVLKINIFVHRVPKPARPTPKRGQGADAPPAEYEARTLCAKENGVPNSPENKGQCQGHLQSMWDPAGRVHGPVGPPCTGRSCSAVSRTPSCPGTPVWRAAAPWLAGQTSAVEYKPTGQQCIGWVKTGPGWAFLAGLFVPQA